MIFYTKDFTSSTIDDACNKTILLDDLCHSILVLAHQKDRQRANENDVNLHQDLHERSTISLQDWKHSLFHGTKFQLVPKKK